MIAGVRLYDEGVLPGRRSHVQHDIALVVTTQDGRSMRQGYDIAVAWPTIHYQDRVAVGVIDGASLAVSLRAHLERLLTGPADLRPTRPNCTETAHIPPLGIMLSIWPFAPESELYSGTRPPAVHRLTQ